MNRIYKTIGIGIAVLMACVFYSCEHEICTDHPYHGYGYGYVDVKFHWNEVDRSEAQVMAVCFFPLDGGQYVRYDFTTQDSVRIRVPQCRYRVLCFTSDRSNVYCSPRETACEEFAIFSDRTTTRRSLESLGVQTKNLPPVPDGTENESMNIPTQSVYGDTVQILDVAQEFGVYKVDFTPKAWFKRYTVHFKNVPNLKYIKSTAGNITSLADRYLPFGGGPSQKRATYPLPMTFDAEGCTMDGALNAFGHHQDGKVWLAVYMILSDERQFYSFHDITNQVRKAGDSHVVSIVIDSLAVPKPIVNGSGMQPSVTDWEAVKIGLKM